ALARSDVPVPVAAWHEPDAALLGTPFYLMYRMRVDTMPLIWYGRRTPRLLAAAAGLGARPPGRLAGGRAVVPAPGRRRAAIAHGVRAGGVAGAGQAGGDSSGAAHR